MVSATYTANSQTGLRKKIGFLWFLGPSLLPAAGYFIGRALSDLAPSEGMWATNAMEAAFGGNAFAALFAFWTAVVVYGAVPFVDAWVGEDDRNPTDDDMPGLDADRYYRLLTLSVIPLQIFNLLFCGWLFVQGVGGWVGQIGWLVSAGIVSGATVITTAHELIHKQPKLERWAGSVLLSSVWYATFTPEHLYGHHRHVATPDDGSTAYLNENVYRFSLRALANNPKRGYEIAAFRARKRGFSAWSWRNEMVPLTLLSVALTLASFALGGVAGLVFFLGQALYAILLLEFVNYIEHYGLMRRKLPNGRYERVAPRHSWNANQVVTNNLLFQLQRHSDHHANGSRRYQTLRHFEEAPQLPFGYATAIVVAAIPPLWKRIMNPRVAEWEASQPEL